MKKKYVITTFLILFGFLSYFAYHLIKKAERSSKYSSASAAIQSLHIACEDYYNEYGKLPLADSTSCDTIRITTGSGDNNIMPTLCGPHPQTKSTKDENFFTFKESKEETVGLVRNPAGTKAELFDPWGHPYRVLLDYGYDNKLRDPFNNEIHFETKVLIWSAGPDGKTGTPEADKDDIRSWY